MESIYNIYEVMNQIDDDASLNITDKKLNEGLFDGKKSAEKEKELFQELDPSGNINSINSLVNNVKSAFETAFSKAIAAMVKERPQEWRRFYNAFIEKRKGAAKAEFNSMLASWISLFKSAGFEKYTTELEKLRKIGVGVYRSGGSLYKQLCKTANKELPDAMEKSMIPVYDKIMKPKK